MEIVVVVPDAKNACSELVASEIEPLVAGDYFFLASRGIASKLSFRRKSKSPLYFLVKPYVMYVLCGMWCARKKHLQLIVPDIVTHHHYYLCGLLRLVE